MNSENKPMLVELKVAATQLGLKKNKLWLMARGGWKPAVRVGKLWFVNMEQAKEALGAGHVG